MLRQQAAPGRNRTRYSHLRIRQLFSDVTHGLFQVYSLRWIGGNEDPDIFEYVFHSSKFPPNGANRRILRRPAGWTR